MNHYFGLALLLCYGWSQSQAVNSMISAVGGNANGQPCVFPFKYKSKWYLDCTSDDGSAGRLWCATTANYDEDKKWGYCTLNLSYAIGGNANGEPCVFPFKYSSTWYPDCTGYKSSGGRLWCSTTSDYDKDKKWGYCTRNFISAVEGKASGEPCAFPFKYKSKWYMDCTGDGTSDGRLWCATTADYDTDGIWGYCSCKLVFTIGGNANGLPCVFPFTYKSQSYSDCTGDGSSDGRLWCATTSNYDTDQTWGYCSCKLIYAVGGTAHGEPCVFPFTYKSKTYSDCTGDDSTEGHLWCATTADYDTDKKWGYCTRNLIYAVGGTAKGEPCVFPFKYKSTWYSDCTSDDSSEGRLWCSTTSDYEKDKKWGYCTRNSVEGKTSNAPCAFPFKYYSKWYMDCTGDANSGLPWCAKTADYGTDGSWGYCSCKSINTVGGNANGQPCVFPFIYASKSYSECTGSPGNNLWCATTSNYDTDGKWGYCSCKSTYAVGGTAHGEPCVFPFTYNSKLYSDCTGDDASEGRLWCATTTNFDKDKKWGYCTRNLISAVGGNADGQPCVFPFKYNEKWYSDCTNDGTSDVRFWCATTADYNKDQKWGYCSANDAHNCKTSLPTDDAVNSEQGIPPEVKTCETSPPYILLTN
ncbi:uncharacterized protein [Aquarana catesbeiana]|uniref:uncharacterized protein isoform X2 n=1 Tax=Aquarana catesbeiana TaxID=8400 RepID=UPI003CC93F71